MKKLLGAYAVGVGIFYVGVTYFFEPAMAGDLPEGPMLPNPGALLVGFALQVWFYDWVTQQIGDPMKAAMAIASLHPAVAAAKKAYDTGQEVKGNVEDAQAAVEGLVPKARSPMCGNLDIKCFYQHSFTIM